MKLSLAGKWLFRATDEESFLPAVVPGCQYLDLLHNKVLPDPYFGTNEQAVQWVHDKDYLYKKTFLLTQKELDFQYAELYLDKVDSIAEIRINGEMIGETENCHAAYLFSIKDRLRVGENVLEVLFFSPKKHVEKKYRETPTPINANGQNGIVHIRKPQYHFGWDWGPVLTPVGLGGKVYIDFFSGKKLSELSVRTEKNEDGSFSVTVRAENAEKITLSAPDGETWESTGENASFSVKNPLLWWTKELSRKSEQPLYTVTAIKGEDSLNKTIGLRTIELDRSQDQYGYNFRFILNGIPLFIKGANYIPPDCFPTRFDQNNLEHLLDAVQYSNMNMIRVWGGGYYADDDLLSACDRRGILVWQDFPFACQAYPFFDEAFLQNVLSEVEYNVKRISSHPCLAVWCGNNEIEEMHLSWATMRRYVEWTEKFFYDILPKEIRKIDLSTPYTPGSPVGTSHNQNVRADFVGDTHLWGVWHGLQKMNHYRKRLTRFCSEFGFESLPSFPTVQKYAEEKDYPLSSAVQKAHQKCAGGNDKMLKYIADRFPLSEKTDELVYLSQITQSTCIRDAVEHWRRNKGRCNGAMYWQLNDCWPACSWSGYDYYGEYKALLYAGNDFFAPVSLSVEDEKDKLTVYLLNDLNESVTAEVETIRFTFSEKKDTKKEQYTLAPLENKVLFSLSAKGWKKDEGIAFRLYIGDKCVQQKTYLTKKEKSLPFPKDKIIVEEKVEGNTRAIVLSSPVYHRYVSVENVGRTSENFFDLLPGERKIVYTSDLTSPLRIRTMADISPVSPLKTLIARLKVYFSLRNLANMIYHARVPKDNR